MKLAIVEFMQVTQIDPGRNYLYGVVKIYGRYQEQDGTYKSGEKFINVGIKVDHSQISEYVIGDYVKTYGDFATGKTLDGSAPFLFVESKFICKSAVPTQNARGIIRFFIDNATTWKVISNNQTGPLIVSCSYDYNTQDKHSENFRLIANASALTSVKFSTWEKKKVCVMGDADLTVSKGYVNTFISALSVSYACFDKNDKAESQQYNQGANQTPSYNQSSPAPSYNQGAPAPSYNQGAPAPAYNQSAPAPAYNQSAPAPSYNQGAPAPSYNQGANQTPSYNQSAPAPAYNQGVPAPAYNQSAPAPAYNQGINQTSDPFNGEFFSDPKNFTDINDVETKL